MAGPENPTYEWGRGKEAYRIKGISPQLQGVYSDFNDLRKGSVVLDVGAGEMRFTENAPKNRNYTIYGLEVTEGGVENFYTSGAKFKRGLQRLLTPSAWRRSKDHNVRADATELDYRSAEGSQRLQADGAVSWRVLHALKREDHFKVCKDIYDALPPGGSFHVAVLADKDWKLDALRKQLEKEGKVYDGSARVDLQHVMDFPENSGKAVDDPTRRSDLEYFFSKESLRELAERTGFEVVGDIQEFTEASGLPHLLNHPQNVAEENYSEGKYDRSKVKYYYVHFRKPLDKSI